MKTKSRRGQNISLRKSGSDGGIRNSGMCLIHFKMFVNNDTIIKR